MRNTKITVLCVLFVVVQFLSQENGGVLVGVEAFTVAPPSLTTTATMSTTTPGTTGGRSSTIILAMGDSSSSSSVSLPPVAEVKQEIRSLFAEYCDEDRLLNMKTIESMPPFVDLLVC